MPFFTHKPECPYCAAALESTPTRKKKCPHCGKYIFVLEGKLVTEDDAAISDMLARLSGFGVTRKDFDNQRKQLSNRFGFTAPVNDTFWGIFNEMISKSRDQHTKKMIYYEMARLISGEGKDPKPYLSEALQIELQGLKKDGAKTVRIANYSMRGDDPSTCKKCRALQGKKVDVDIALQTLPVPPLCEQDDGWCRCSYISEQEWKLLQI